MNKKGDMSIAIVVLVVATLLLVIFSLVYFSLRADEINESLFSPHFLEDLYSREIWIDIHLQDIVEKSAKGVRNENEFIDNFEREASYYKLKDESYLFPELPQILNELEEKDVEIINNEVKVKLKISTSNNFADDNGKEMISAVHEYEKLFKAEV